MREDKFEIWIIFLILLSLGILGFLTISKISGDATSVKIEAIKAGLEQTMGGRWVARNDKEIENE